MKDNKSIITNQTREEVINKIGHEGFCDASERLTEITGTDLEVVSQDEAEEADAVVCTYAGMESEEFKKDNIYTTCADCGAAITHRPHVPAKPKKLCMVCVMEYINEEG